MAIHQNVSEFKAELKELGARLDTRLKVVIPAVILLLLTRIVERTPVSIFEREYPGRLAGSWSVSRDSVGGFMIPEGEIGSRDEAIERAASKLSSQNPYSVWYIYNNVPYADVVEYGLYPYDGPRVSEGYSTQAPEGMMRISVLEIMDDIEGMLRNVF